MGRPVTRIHYIQARPGLGIRYLTWLYYYEGESDNIDKCTGAAGPMNTVVTPACTIAAGRAIVFRAIEARLGPGIRCATCL